MLECTSGSEVLTVVAEDNLTVVYSILRNITRFGRFQAPLVVFGQNARALVRYYAIENNEVVRWLADCPLRRGSHEAHSLIAGGSRGTDRRSAAGTRSTGPGTERSPATAAGAGRSVRARPRCGAHQHPERRSFGAARRFGRCGCRSRQRSADGERQPS